MPRFCSHRLDPLLTYFNCNISGTALLVLLSTTCLWLSNIQFIFARLGFLAHDLFSSFSSSVLYFVLALQITDLVYLVLLSCLFVCLLHVFISLHLPYQLSALL